MAADSRGGIVGRHALLLTIKIQTRRKKLKLKLKLTIIHHDGCCCKTCVASTARGTSPGTNDSPNCFSALRRQATIHPQRDSDTRERALIKDFETRLLKATAVNKTPPGSSTPSSTRSTIPRTCLNMGSLSVLYNGPRGTSTSAMSKAAVGRVSALHLPLRPLPRKNSINF